MKHTTGKALVPDNRQVSELGSYHLIVVDATDRPVKRTDKSLIDNAKFSLTCEVLAGTVESEIGKTAEIVFFHTKPDAKEYAHMMDQMREDRVFLALGLLPIEALELRKDSKIALREGVEFDIDMAKAIGRQFVAKFSDKDKEGKYIQFGRLEAFHVDDPEVAAIPKDQGGLKTLPSSLRWIGGLPANIKPAAQKEANGNGTSQKQGAAAANATSFDDV